MTNYTPGPWQWHTSNSIKRLTSVDERVCYDHGGNVLHAYVSDDGAPDVNVSPADMALIAMAPELYGVIKHLYRHYYTHWTEEDRIMAKEIMAKALGKT